MWNNTVQFIFYPVYFYFQYIAKIIIVRSLVFAHCIILCIILYLLSLNLAQGVGGSHDLH